MAPHSPLEAPGIRLLAGPQGGAVGAAAAPAAMLDTKGQNVPSGASGPPQWPGNRPKWTKQQWRVRGSCRDFLLLAERNGSLPFFLTLTSSLPGSGELLRRHFQAFRKRLSRKLGLEPRQISYRGVDTEEGRGVLHLLVAVPPGYGRSGRFLVSVEWIRRVWQDLHGARQFRIVPVRAGKASSRRLSRYIVSQYVGGQDALVRMSGSLMSGASSRERREFLRVVMGDARRYSQGFPCSDEGVAAMRRHWWFTFRVGWESLISTGMAWVFGHWVVRTLDGRLEYV